MKRISLIFLLMMAMIHVNGQCPQKFELKKFKPSELGNDGKIQISIRATSSYKIELLEIQDAEDKSLKSYLGAGNKTFLFDRLKSNSLFKIIIAFEDEEKFLCKRKVVTNISLTDN